MKVLDWFTMTISYGTPYRSTKRYRIVKGEVYNAGQDKGEVYNPGQEKGVIYNAGMIVGEVK